MPCEHTHRLLLVAFLHVEQTRFAKPVQSLSSTPRCGRMAAQTGQVRAVSLGSQSAGGDQLRAAALDGMAGRCGKARRRQRGIPLKRRSLGTICRFPSCWSSSSEEVMCLPLAAIIILEIANAELSGMTGRERIDGVLCRMASGWSRRALARVLLK